MLHDLPPFPRNDSPYVFDDGTGSGPSLVEFEVLVERHARRLQQLGVRRLLWIADNTPHWPLLELAAQRAGIVLVPSSPWISPEQAHYRARVVGCDGILTDEPESLEDTFGSGEPLPPTLGTRGWRVDPGAPLPDLPEGTVRVTFTRGATAPPRGICHRGDTLWERGRVLRQALRATRHDRHLALLPLEKVAALEWTVIVPLLSGAHSILVPLRPHGASADNGAVPEAIADTIDRFSPSTLLLTPRLLASWLQSFEDPLRDRPADLRRVVTIGAPLPRPLRQRGEALGLPIFEGYDLTEACGILAMDAPHDRRSGTVGRPLDGLAAQVSDDGELRLRGPLGEGALGSDGFQPAAETLDTGDQAYVDDDGFISVQGRRENRISLSDGRSLSPEWIEETLRTEPAIEEAFIFGDREGTLTAVILPRPGHRSLVDRAVRDVNQHLPAYARLHRWHVLDEPLTRAAGTLNIAGRPDRRGIRERYLHASHSLQA